MKVLRISDNARFYVYDIKEVNSNITFLIFDMKTNKWIYCNADEFLPVEEQYFG